MSGQEILTQSVVLFISLFGMMIGLIFTVVPPLPGTVIIWAAAIFYGLALGWEELGWLTFSLLTVLMLLGIIADALGGQFGAKLGGASCLAIFLGSVIGFGLGIVTGLVGTPLVGCLVGVAGTLGGILLVERLRYGDWQAAITATQGYLAGTTAGILAKITTGCFMIGVFLIKVFWPA
jgi:hypothetical protein